MLPTINLTIGLQVAAINTHCAGTHEEELAQRNGRPVRLPFLRDRIVLHVGEFFIKAGEKLTSAGQRNMRLTDEAA
jgi:hypothetical protein